MVVASSLVVEPSAAGASGVDDEPSAAASRLVTAKADGVDTPPDAAATLAVFFVAPPEAEEADKIADKIAAKSFLTPSTNSAGSEHAPISAAPEVREVELPPIPLMLFLSQPKAWFCMIMMIGGRCPAAFHSVKMNEARGSLGAEC